MKRLAALLVLGVFLAGGSAAQSWSSSAANMPTARDGLAASTGPNGDIYAIGGSDANGISSAVEEHDVSSNSWSTVASMPTARQVLASSTGPNGNIYAIGGADGSFAPFSTVEKYDVSSNSWSAVASMPTPRASLAAATGPNGDIYAIGGQNSNFNPVSTVEKYDVSSNSWSTVASMPTARRLLTAATGPNGDIYAIGGLDSNSNPVSTVEKYDVSSNSWSTVASMPTARRSLTSNLGSDGDVYAIGGSSPNGDIPTVESYDVASNSWSTEPNMPTARESLAASAGPNGNIYAVGGKDSSGVLSTVEVLQFNSNPSVDSASVTPDPPLIGQSVSYSFSASDSDGTVESVELEVFDDGTKVFSQTDTSVSSGSVSKSFSNVATATAGDFDAVFTVVDDAGASTTQTLNRTLTDTDPSISLSQGSSSQFSQTRSFTVDTTATDSVPNEDLSCTLNTSYATLDQRTVTEGASFTVDADLQRGSSDTTVTCTESDGDSTTAGPVSSTVTALSFQSTTADEPKAIERTSQDYFATVKHGDFVQSVDFNLSLDGAVSDQATITTSGISTRTESFTGETPLISTAKRSVPFQVSAEVTFTDRTGATDTFTASSSQKTQDVFRKILTDCSNAVKGVTGPQAQRIVLRNETEQSTNVTGNIEYNYDVKTPGSPHTRNFAFTQSNTDTATTCINPGFAEYEITGPVSYDATGFGGRVFPVQGATITNSTTTLPLFLLPNTDSTDTIIRVETPSGSPIDGTVKVKRFDVGTNTFTTAAKLQTGSDGEAEVGLEDGAFYEFVVQRDGEVIFTRDQERFNPATVPATVELTVGQQLPDLLTNDDGFQFKVEQVKNGGNITGLEATVNHRTSAIQNATLQVEKSAVIGTETICTKTVQTSASTLFCDFNGSAEGESFTFELTSFVGGNEFVLQTGTIDKTKGLFGINQAFAGFLIFLSLSAFGFVTPRLTVLFSTAGVVAAYTLGLISVGIGAIASLVMVALIVTFAGERTV